MIDDIERCIIYENGKELDRDYIDRVAGGDIFSSIFSTGKKIALSSVIQLKIDVFFKNGKVVTIPIYDHKTENSGILYSSLYKSLYRRCKKIVLHFYSFRAKNQDSWA